MIVSARVNGQKALKTESVLQEAKVCGLPKHNPHSIIAQDLGCPVLKGRITRLCFVGHLCLDPDARGQTWELMQRAMHQAMLRALRSARQTSRIKVYSGVLKGVGRIYEWYGTTVQTALRRNDLDALEGMRTWLDGDSRVFRVEEEPRVLQNMGSKVEILGNISCKGGRVLVASPIRACIPAASRTDGFRVR
jgi:hypothetical protein